MSDEFVEKKSIGKVLLIIFIVLVILGGMGFGGYTLFKKTILNPEMYLTMTKKYLLSDFFKDIKLFSNEKDSKFNGTITFKTDNKEMNYINHLVIDYNMLSSFDKEELQYNYNFKEDNKEILDTNLFLIKDSIYFDSKDLYDKVLLISKLDVNIFSELKKLNDNSKDSIDSFNYYLNSLIDALKEMNMTSEMISIYKVKYTYEINDSNRDKIQNKYDELINNNKTIQELIKKEVVSKDLFNIKFSNIKVEIIKSIGTNKIYNLDIYEDNEKTFTLEMDKNDDNIYHIKSNNETGTLIIDKDTYTLQIFEKEVLVNTIKFVNNKNLFKFSITNSDGDLSFGLKKENKNKFNITFMFKDENDSIDLTATINKKDKGFDISSVIDFTIDKEKIRIKLDGNIEYGDNLLLSKDISSAVDINSLSENEQSKISENLMKKLQGTKLLDLLTKQENNL